MSIMVEDAGFTRPTRLQKIVQLYKLYWLLNLRVGYMSDNAGRKPTSLAEWSILLAIFVAIVISIESRLLGYVIFPILMAGVFYRAKRNTRVFRTRDLMLLLFAPQVIISIALISSRQLANFLEWLSILFDDYFPLFFVGITNMTERLAKDGYVQRVESIKGFALLAFLTTTFFACRYLVAMGTIGDTYKMLSKPVNVDQTWIQRNGGILCVVVGLLWAVMFLDFYAPSCTSRCSRIQYSNFPGVIFLTLLYSITYACIGVLINFNLMHAALLKYSRKED
jgi:hypothetical protein